MFIINQIVNHRLTSLIILSKRSTVVRPDFDLGNQMKLLNEQKQFEKVLQLFDQSKKKHTETPSSFMVTQALKACAQIGDLQRGSAIHHFISSRIKNDHYILASLIHLYMQCGDVTRAQSLFDTSSNKTLSMYGAMMKGYITNNQAKKAIDLFNEITNSDQVIIILLFNACAQLGTDEALDLAKSVSSQIPKSFHSNARLSTSLMDALIKCGDCSTAEILFSKIRQKSVTTYGNLMNGFNKENNPKKTLKLFDQMKLDGIEPNSIIYLCIIKALSQIGDYSLCELITEHIPNSVIDNQLRNVLIDMWGKAGDVDRAKECFQRIPQPDHYGYTSMINTYGLNGMGNEAIELFHEMSSEFIDEANLVCVLHACSHSGLVHQARSIFANIPMRTVKTYTTMIDCLSRASMFEEAQALINEYECDHSPAWPMYMALLSGARNEKNSHLSQQVFDRMKKLFSELTTSMTSASVLLGNVYGSSGELEKAADIRIQLQKTGAKKIVGVTRTVINGKLSELRAHDQSHPRTLEIYAEAEKISKQLTEHGHHFDSSWITRELREGETVESALCGHSERLAIALNFVVNPHATRIQITKNLRVCGDCHAATKLIAHIRQCEIIVRDANRIHHFYKNGRCSCNDYF